MPRRHMLVELLPAHHQQIPSRSTVAAAVKTIANLTSPGYFPDLTALVRTARRAKVDHIVFRGAK
jgi:hypothetical protein